MPAAITDLITKASNGTRPVPTTLNGSLPSGASPGTANTDALTGWATTTAVHFAIYNIDSNGNKVAGSQTDWKGIVSGATITNLTLKAGTNTGYSVGAIVEATPTAAWADDLATHILTQHKQDGTHSAITADSVTAPIGNFTSLTVGGTATTQGWSALGSIPSSITGYGERNFDLIFNSTDLTSTLSPGMRLQLARTVAAPVQCSSLNGTTHYFSKSSPADTTFTDDFACSAWIKLNAYPSGDNTIISRYNGTSGWKFVINANGQIKMSGFNGGSSNESNVLSGNVIPLNQWVHVAAQLDMSSFSTTSTTSYTMINGVQVSCNVSRQGTNPTALVQAGNLEVGSQNGGTLTFNGKLAQVAYYKTKVTQAAILATINRTLSGSESGLVSAWTLSGASGANDLNTTNANNLTAQNGVATTNADGPFGNSGVSTTIELGIVQSVAFATNTTANVQMAEGCQLPTSGGISAVNYSTHKEPFGFPAAPEKWTIQSILRYSAGQSGPSNGTYYTPGNIMINVPIGSWKLSWNGVFDFSASAGTGDGVAGVSSSVSSETDFDLMAYYVVSTRATAGVQYRDKNLSLTVATPYYMLLKCISGSWVDVQTRADKSPFILKAVNALL